jgi:peptidylprolyl isomerase
MIQTGQKVSVHYVGTLEDGAQFDNSYERGTPLEVEVGVGKVIPGFDKALMSMEIGEIRDVAIPETEAYGPRNPDAVETVPRGAFPAEMQLSEGMQVQGQGPMGPIIATVMQATDESVTLDMNHPLAGQTLNFKIELISLL